MINFRIGRFPVTVALTVILGSPLMVVASIDGDRDDARANLAHIITVQLSESRKLDALRELGLQAEDIQRATQIGGDMLADCYLGFFDNFNGSERDYLVSVSVMVPDALSFLSRVEILVSKYADGDGDLDDSVIVHALDILQACASDALAAAGLPERNVSSAVKECKGNQD